MKTVDELLSQGDEAWAEMNPERALECAEEALGLEPRSMPALELKASALAELGDFELADEAFDELRKREPRNLAFALSAADVLIRQPGDDRDRIEDGLAILEEIEPAARKDDELRLELQLLRGVALNQLGECDDALRALDQVLKLDPDNGEAALERAVALFELCRFDEAQKAFSKVAEAFADEPWAHHYLGLIAERRGGNAEQHFERARRLMPDEFPKPVTLTAEEFDRATAEAIDQLPAHAKPHLENVVINVEPLPSNDDLKEGGVSPIVLGLFRGTPIDERSPVEASHHETARITLYQKNLERFAKSRDELIEEIGVTVLHEVGHLLGLDEDELYDRGLD